MENIFLAIFLLSPLFLIVGLMEPRIFSNLLKRQVSRKAISVVCFIAFCSSFIGIGITADTSKKEVVENPIENSIPTPLVEVSSFRIDTSNMKIAKVLRVVDGDTIEVSLDSKTEKIRVIGINTPETVDPRKSVECFGIEASNKAKELLKVGGEIFLEPDPTQSNRDKYSRLLRFIWINEDLDFGKYMIEQGYAYEYTENVPYKYQSLYKTAQDGASTAKVGLWAEGVCVSPTPTAKPTPYPTVKPTSVPVIYFAPTKVPTVYVPPVQPPHKYIQWIFRWIMEL